PKAVAIDLILADDPSNAGNSALAAAIRDTANVVLASPLLATGWEDPLPMFRQAAAGIGHVYADPDPVSREITLHKAAGHDRRWALALEAYRAGLGKPIVETQYDVEIGDVVIPSPDRKLRIRYRMPEHPVPQVSLARLLADPTIAR